MTVVESPQLKDLRFTYLQKVTEVRSSGCVVYVDESYVNKSHTARRCWLRKGSQVNSSFILEGVGR